MLLSGANVTLFHKIPSYLACIFCGKVLKLSMILASINSNGNGFAKSSTFLEAFWASWIVYPAAIAKFGHFRRSNLLFGVINHLRGKLVWHASAISEEEGLS